jgi:hypothetical protein
MSLIANIISESLILLSFCKLDNRCTVTPSISVPVGLLLLLLNYAGVMLMLHQDNNAASPSMISSAYSFFLLPTVIFYFSIAFAWMSKLASNIDVYSKPKLVLMSYLLMILFIPSLVNLIARVSNHLNAKSSLPFFTYFVHQLLAVASVAVVLGIMLLYFMKYHPHDFEDDYVERLHQDAPGIAIDDIYDDDIYDDDVSGDNDDVVDGDSSDDHHSGENELSFEQRTSIDMMSEVDITLHSSEFYFEYCTEDNEYGCGNYGDDELSVSTLCGHYICDNKSSPYCLQVADNQLDEPSLTAKS